MSEGQEGGIGRAGWEKRLKWLIGIRLLVAILFLGSAAIVQMQEAPPYPTGPLFFLLGLTFALSGLYTILLPWVKRLDEFTGFQLAGDLFLSTGLVHYTGGIVSPLTFVYIFPIFGSGTLLGRRESLWLASLGSILFGLLIDFEYYQIIPPVGHAASTYASFSFVFFRVFINIVAFFLVALLSSDLAERLREAGRQLEAQRTDIRNLKTLYQDVIANISSGIMTLDLEGRIASFNATAERITGVKASEVIGLSYSQVGLDEFPGLKAFSSRKHGSDRAEAFEDPFPRRDGAVLPIGVTYSSLRDGEERLLGTVAIFQDLTERKQIEEHLRRADRLAAVGQLAASIAHEVRNPLAAISGSIQLLHEELKGQGHEQLLGLILREADRLKLITGQFLDHVRVPGPPGRECDLVATLEETLFLLQQSDECHPGIHIDFEKRLGALPVLAERDRLKQIFWNIGLNALQAMPRGGTLAVIVREEDSLGAVEFHDSGEGIPADQLSRIFEPFYTTKSRGTGLGLAIAKRLVEDLGGRIEVQSPQTGGGAIFEIYLRRYIDVTSEEANTSTLSSATGPR
ncbi:MAG: nitrogen regulation protein NR(II) [Candidatus Methylomirabilales bacterium]